MANMLSDAAQWLADQQTDHLSQTVTYRRGGSGGDSVSLDATPGAILNGIDPTFGILRVNERDWWIKAELLILDSETVAPQKNDEIVEADGTVWLVLPTDFEQEAKLLYGGYSYRIHTKRIKEPD